MFAPNHLLLASIEGLLFFVVIIAISAVSNWLKQKQQREQGDGPEDEEGPHPAAKTDWQAELRQLLEGKRPTPPPQEPTATAPAPPVEPPTLAPAPSAPAWSQPRPASRSHLEPAPLSASQQAAEVARLDAEVAASKRELEQRLASLRATKSVGDQVEAARRDWLSELPQPTRGPGRPGLTRRTNAPARRVRAALRRPGTTRDLVIAAEILGQPKGLQR